MKKPVRFRALNQDVFAGQAGAQTPDTCWFQPFVQPAGLPAIPRLAVDMQQKVVLNVG